MNARTVTRLCKELFDDRVASWTNHAGNIVAEGSLSRELRERIAVAVPRHYPSFYAVPPLGATLTPEEWELVLAMPETRTVDSAVTTDYFVLIKPDGSSIYAHCHTL